MGASTIVCVCVRWMPAAGCRAGCRSGGRRSSSLPQLPHAAAAWPRNCCNPVAFWPCTCPIGPSPACHRRIETKELKLRPATDVHDYQVGGGGLWHAQCACHATSSAGGGLLARTCHALCWLRIVSRPCASSLVSSELACTMLAAAVVCGTEPRQAPPAAGRVDPLTSRP